MTAVQQLAWDALSLARLCICGVGVVFVGAWVGVKFGWIR